MVESLKDPIFKCTKLNRFLRINNQIFASRSINSQA